MKKLFYKDADFQKELEALYNRAPFPPEAEKAAADIISAVRKNGDAALIEFAAKFDKIELTSENMIVSKEEIDAACRKLSAGDKKAIRTAFEQIKVFAKTTLPVSWKASPRPGVIFGEKFTPMDRVGVYVPGGTAPLVSTVLHTAGIAAAAGVKEIVGCTPPGGMHPATLYAMKLVGVKTIYRLGGAYAVAAMGIGTETVKKVEKIVGPGNAYVTAAKKLLYGEVAIDLVAGPSEILVVADKTANPAFVAADLLSQAEHGSGLEQAVMVTDSPEMIEKVEAEVLRQKVTLPREQIVDKVLNNGVFLICVANMDDACALAGNYAPEHLEIQAATPEKWANKISSAGAIFLGPWTPESAGDFCAGPSHVLPTASSAHSFNGLETSSFIRRTSIVKYSEKALRREAEIIERFGNMEMLAAHGRAATIRVKK